MEIDIPFSNRKISLEKSSQELKYRAILSRDSLFYGLFDKYDELLHDGLIDVETIPKTSHLKKQKFDFDHAVIAFNNSIFSLSNSNNEKFNKSLLKFNHSISEMSHYNVGSERLKNSSSKLIFGIPRPIVKALSKHINNCVFTHYQKVFLDSIEKRSFIAEIYLSLISGNLNLILFKNGNLQLVNCYQVRNESDFFYYLALIFDQFKLVKGETQIFMDGDYSEVKLDDERFFQFFGIEPKFICSDHRTSETNTTLVSLTRLNRCASLEEV